MDLKELAKHIYDILDIDLDDVVECVTDADLKKIVLTTKDDKHYLISISRVGRRKVIRAFNPAPKPTKSDRR